MNGVQSHSQRAVVNSSMSKWRAVMSGISQGSLMGPGLLNTFVSDMDHETECVQQVC